MAQTVLSYVFRWFGYPQTRSVFHSYWAVFHNYAHPNIGDDFKLPPIFSQSLREYIMSYPQNERFIHRYLTLFHNLYHVNSIILPLYPLNMDNETRV